MSNQEFTSRALSFWQLAGETKIEIPIIQRDYAQGRDSERRIRNNFLDALLLATRDGNNLELDFVYGSLDKGSLQPLDGQQRLTTLFLLHWYIACKEGHFQLHRERFARFTYETRASSRSFCTQLSLKGVDFDNLLPNDEGKNNRISKTLTDSSWYFLAWRRDPTINAMLQMLDAIDEKFKDAEPIWGKLNTENRITFHYIELRHFGLSDDLYIKMNARGKPLTAFENFKAKLEQYIALKEWETESDTGKFAELTDQSWTDLFWIHRNAEKKIDPAFLKFLAGSAISMYAQNLMIADDPAAFELTLADLQKRSGKKTTSEAVKRELIEKRIERLYNKPNELEPADLVQVNDLNYLKSSLNCYADKVKRYDKMSSLNLDLWDYCNDSTLFKAFINTDAPTTYKQRVLFYAQTAYLQTGEFEADAFADWLRVTRNIVQHATIDSANTFIGAIGLVRELAEGSNDIYSYLSEKKPASNFASVQVNEEVQKAGIIKYSPDHRALIHAVEDTAFCKGRIGFALYCIGYDDNPSTFDAGRLDQVRSVIHEYLSKADVSNDFRRALFTIGDNSFYNYWWSWSYNTDTDKRRMIENTGDLKDIAYNGFKHYLKDLVNLLTEKSLSNIISEFVPAEKTPNWKVRLIREPALLDKYTESRYFGVTKDQQTCYLFLNRKRPGSRGDCHRVN